MPMKARHICSLPTLALLMEGKQCHIALMHYYFLIEGGSLLNIIVSVLYLSVMPCNVDMRSFSGWISVAN